MAPRSIRRRGTLLSAATVAALVGSFGIALPASAAADPGAAPIVSADDVAASKLSASLVTAAGGRHQVFVQLSGSGAADAAADASSSAAGKVAAKVRRDAVAATAKAAFGAARATDSAAAQLFTVSNAVPGFAADLDADAIAALAARSDVVSITPLVPKKLENASTAQLTNAISDWQAGNLGTGVKVGIIDTGIDYTHADFGGAGTVAAWDAAHADPASAWVPTAKVVGGYDFVGDDYDADPDDTDTYQPVPHPDTNPLGCNNHGTHVAGIVGGYGVNGDGTTFTGDYAALSSDDLYGMTVAPGMAPLASLYALKVFGCEGSTDVVIPALDWSLDPNGDGDFSDHLDIVNLSLGSDYAPADDPENAVVDQLAKHGVLPVIAMGNAGDLTDAGGSPGNATRAVAVASTVDAYQLRDGLQVDAPADVAGIAAGQFSIAYPWASSAPVSGTVVVSPADNADGCAPYSATDAAAVAGKIVWQYWDDNDATRVCGSAARAGNAAAAGAIGAIFTSSLDVFAAGITGSDAIPVIQLPKAETDRLQAAATAGTLVVTFDGALAATVKSVTPGITDTVSSFSSRGTHGTVGVVKPDLAAPGDTIASAGLGSGNGVLVESGTSMATPNVAGIAALAKVAHPTWSTEQLKADLMNTAGHDVYSGDDQTGPIYGPNRVGAGRVDAAAAVTNDVLVYDLDVKGAVSASFGVVPVSIDKKSQSFTRTLAVENTSNRSRTLSLSYDAITAQPGVTYTVSPKTVTVRAGRTAKVTVTLTVVPSKLTKTLDPTMSLDSGIGVPRSYVSDSSGRVLVAEQGKAALRVPVYGAVKPTSSTSTKAVTVGKGSSATSALALSGKGFDQGSGNEEFASLVSVLQLGATSGRLQQCKGTQTSGCTLFGSQDSGDLRYVGTGSASGYLWFGLTTWGEWAVDGAAQWPEILIDTTGDGVPDFDVWEQNYPSADVPIVVVANLTTGAQTLVPVNFNWGDVDTNVYDSDTILLPVPLAKLGVTSTTTSFPITYQVSTFSAYTGDVIDQSPAITYDAVDPALSVSDPLYFDQGGTTIPFTLGSDATKDTKALVLHLQGATGQRAEVVSVTGKVKATPPGKHHGTGSLKPWSKHWRLGSAGD